jgi:hypothetical protein
MKDLTEVLAEISALPKYWHAAGALSPRILRAIVEHCAHLDVHHSLETGSGKSTLLFSHLSRNHLVFSMDDGNGSLEKVLASPLLRGETVHVIEGPSQTTMPAHRFEAPLQVALIDGPHGYPFPDLEYFHIYPHLETNAVLILDDIEIRTVHNVFEFLKADEMFELIEVVGTTAFFRRTAAATFDPHGDSWWTQKYNKKLLWIDRSLVATLKRLVPAAIKDRIKKRLAERDERQNSAGSR